jgi:hypothetical protein
MKRKTSTKTKKKGYVRTELERAHMIGAAALGELSLILGGTTVSRRRLDDIALNLSGASVVVRDAARSMMTKNEHLLNDIP